MTTEEIDLRWKSIKNKDIDEYSMLRIGQDGGADISIAVNRAGERFLILKVPDGVVFSIRKVTLQNLSIEWIAQSRYILIGLRNQRYFDLFNDLAISMYERIREITDPGIYSAELVNNFHRWADFFDDASQGLSENVIKGLFGELVVLKWSLQNIHELSVNEILISWQGPYNRAQDFILPQYNLEVKTKSEAETNVRISSEFQLQTDSGKGLRLCIVDVSEKATGLSLGDIIEEISVLIRKLNGDKTIFMAAVTRAGISVLNSDSYDRFRWEPRRVKIYNCCSEGFPSIQSSDIPDGISQVKYSLNTGLLDSFIIQRIIF